MREMERRISDLRSRFSNDFIQWGNTVLGATALKMIAERIRKTGQAPGGGSYKPYSTNPMFVGRKSFLSDTKSNILLGSKKKRKELQWFTVQTKQGGRRVALLDGGYRKLRELQGMQVGHKDFLYTGKMWGDIKVLRTDAKGDGFTTTIGAISAIADEKLEHNQEREGKEILMVTDSEEQRLAQILDEWITNRVNEMLNG